MAPCYSLPQGLQEMCCLPAVAHTISGHRCTGYRSCHSNISAFCVGAFVVASDVYDSQAAHETFRPNKNAQESQGSSELTFSIHP